ncbi:hypothetical protein EC991_002212 [Linnemannia zychae]|nr:hypothetical protein EC991_002212 [Linnemannia zychae]
MLLSSSNVQALWAVSSLTSTTSPDTVVKPNLDEAFYIDVFTDPVTKEGFVFWEDIKLAFDDALHVQRQGSVIPFLEGADSQPKEETSTTANVNIPRRNPAYGLENAAMDNYSHMDIPVALTTVYHTTSRASAQDASNTSWTHASFTGGGDAISRRNPVYGLEEEAMDGYRNNDNPAFQPAPRAPQLYEGDRLSTEKKRSDDTKQLRAPQEHTECVAATTLTEQYIQTMVDARLGKANAQVALGDMYKNGQGVQQDYLTAMDWYLLAAEQGNQDAYTRLGDLHKDGLGVEVDYTAAMNWYQKGTDQKARDSKPHFDGN